MITSERAIEMLKARFLQYRIGYEFILGDHPQLIRKDNALIHKEAVIPALHLLHELEFKGAADEYIKAHEHYRHELYEECLVDGLKAFESKMKTICELRNWSYKASKAAASLLVDTCLKNGLLPTFLSSHLNSIGGCLKDGVPMMRNKTAAHGEGATPRTVPKLYAEYMIHETAVNIVLLVEAFKELPPLN